MTSDLKPCPFCGGEAEYEEIQFQDSDDIAWSVGCKLKVSEHEEDDSCCGYMSHHKFARKCEAAAAWNKRYPLECTACDKPGEHCSNQHGICSRVGGRPHCSAQETGRDEPKPCSDDDYELVHGSCTYCGGEHY